jgi:hypothetical protein
MRILKAKAAKRLGKAKLVQKGAILRFLLPYISYNGHYTKYI